MAGGLLEERGAGEGVYVEFGFRGHGDWAGLDWLGVWGILSLHCWVGRRAEEDSSIVGMVIDDDIVAATNAGTSVLILVRWLAQYHQGLTIKRLKRKAVLEVLLLCERLDEIFLPDTGLTDIYSVTGAFKLTISGQYVVISCE